MARVARKGAFGTHEKVNILISNRVRDVVVDQDHHFLTHSLIRTGLNGSGADDF